MGLRTRAQDLKVLLHDYDPGIVCLQETKLGDAQYNPGLNYAFYNSAPPPGDIAHGGAAVIVSKGIQHHLIPLNSPLQAVAVRAVLGHQVTVCSVYLPGDVGYTINNLQHLIDQLPPPFLLLGDFNAKSPLWGNAMTDRWGKVIEDLLSSNDIVLYNDGAMTYHNIHNNASSAIDLSICSSSIAVDYIWSVNEFLHGSDHFPIHLKYSVNTPTSSPPKWKPQDADWVKYQEGLCLDKDFESFPSHLEAYAYFTEQVLHSANASIPKTGGSPRRPAVPWWDKTCTILRKVTRKCYRRFKNSGSQTTKLIYKRALAKQRQYYRKAKRNSWIYYINGISSKTPSRLVWRKIRKLTGKFVPAPTPSLKINNRLVTDPVDVANSLGKHFSDVSSPSNYTTEFQRIRNSRVKLNLSSSSEPYNATFSLQELSDALSTTDDSSPGEDNILYSMLRHLPGPAKDYLLKILNKIWVTGKLPRSWKIAIVIPIRKPLKDPFLSTSYRPIALTSCVCKLMEKMINTRLMWHLESNNLLSPFQFGCRKNRSTLDPLLRLSNQIQQGFANGRQTIGVFFDLEKAYDTTWRQGIIRQLSRMGICGYMMKFLNSFLSDRFLKVKVGNSFSSLYSQEEGVPQGSVLSVTCFAVAINSILKNISPPVRGSLFVDDFVIYVTSYDAVSACAYLQRAIDAISVWASNTGFKFSSSKTVAVRFKRHRRQEVVPNLILNGVPLPYADEVKFLGLTFDTSLTWGAHITNLKLRVRKSLDILKVVSSFDWGADKQSLLRLYNSLCRSKLDYGCEIYSSACKTRLGELDVVHNMALRLCSGAFRTSPVESIYVDCHQLPLDLRREELGLRYMARLRSHPDNPSNQILDQLRPIHYKANARPFQVRLRDSLEEESLLAQRILPIHHPKHPPWLVPPLTVCSTSFSKKDSPPHLIRDKFLEHDCLSHANAFKIYTDGSKSDFGVGCGVVTKDISEVARLSNHASSFTAELLAIVQALKKVHNTKGKSFVIYTDSRSSIEAIKSYNSFQPLVQKAQEWLYLISTRFKDKSVCFCWVPSHVGIRGNELADEAAKSACSRSIVDRPSIPYMDLYRPIKFYIWNKWQARWSSPALSTNRKYRSIRQSVSIWPSVFDDDRRTEIVLCRLRIGHTHLTHQFLLRGENAPVCAHCSCQLTVEHILVHCPLFHAARLQHGLAGKALSTLLGFEVDIPPLVKFLKEIDIFYLI